MKLVVAFLLTTWALTIPGCAGNDRQDIPIQTLMDEERAQRVPVVLRVRLVFPGDGSKYLWPRVEVLRVLKNDTGLSFNGEMEVAHYSWEEGIPEGVSTIYLVPYRTEMDYWKLLDGSGKSGVSHRGK